MDAKTNIDHKYKAVNTASTFTFGCIYLLLNHIYKAAFITLPCHITHIANKIVYLYSMDESDGYIGYTNVPGEFEAAGQSINRFVEINYETARAVAVDMGITPSDITHYKGRILDIIRNNPPLASVPQYYRDGREEYLWYSDFYDEITKEVYHRYRTFVRPIHEITPANYAEELAKIDLPYFREIVDLVSLERLCMDYEENKHAPDDEGNDENPLNEGQPLPEYGQIKIESTPKVKPKAKHISGKRSYEPKLTGKQYALLAECMETIRLFRCRINVSQLKKLLTGKLTEPLQVANQKSLVYLLDQLSENKYIKGTWISVADGNKDFISFRTEGNRQRYGDKVHYIPMQQFLNDRKRNERESVRGLIEMDEMIELMKEYRDK